MKIIGREIAALPFDERINSVPENIRDQESWSDDTKVQHIHGELLYYLLKENQETLLAELTQEE